MVCSTQTTLLDVLVKLAVKQYWPVIAYHSTDKCKDTVLCLKEILQRFLLVSWAFRNIMCPEVIRGNLLEFCESTRKTQETYLDFISNVRL